MGERTNAHSATPLSVTLNFAQFCLPFLPNGRAFARLGCADCTLGSCSTVGLLGAHRCLVAVNDIAGSLSSSSAIAWSVPLSMCNVHVEANVATERDNKSGFFLLLLQEMQRKEQISDRQSMPRLV